jgi:hypothetical protein
MTVLHKGPRVTYFYSESYAFMLNYADYCLTTLPVAETIKRQIVSWLVNDELQMVWRKGPWPTLRFYPGYFLEALRVTTENLRLLSWPRLEPGTSR